MIDSLVLPGTETLDVRDKEAVAKRIKGAVSAKQHGLEDVLCPLIAEVGSVRLPMASATVLQTPASPAGNMNGSWFAAVHSGPTVGTAARLIHSPSSPKAKHTQTKGPGSPHSIHYAGVHRRVPEEPSQLQCGQCARGEDPRWRRHRLCCCAGHGGCCVL